MADFELTAQGVTIQTTDEIRTEIADAMKSTVDPLINTDPDSLDGLEIGIYASQEREVQEVVQELTDAIDPDNAERERLDVVGSIRGIKRKQATKSTFKGSKAVTMTVKAGAIVTAGKVASVAGDPTIRFVSLADADNSAGVSSSAIPVPFECEVTGPVHANATTLTVMATPDANWVSVINPTDPLLGRDIETDGAYHDRQEEELAKSGSATATAIRSAVLAIEPEPGVFPVLDCLVLENDTDITVNGVPPHSFEVIVWDGSGADAADEDIAQAIYENKAAGIRASGTTLVSVEDSAGQLHPIRFTRPTQRTVNLEAYYLFTADDYVGDTAVQTILSDAFQGIKPAGSSTKLKVGQKPGQTVFFSPYFAILQEAGGVTEIYDFKVSLDGDPTVSWANPAIGLREIAVISTATIELHGEPD